MRSLGGEDEGEFWGIYLRLRVDGKEVEVINVPLDTDVSPTYSKDEIDRLERVIGAPPLSEIQISPIGQRGDESDLSTDIAFQVAERMLAEWGGCVSTLIGYSKGDYASHLLHAC